jgi:CHAT domain
VRFEDFILQLDASSRGGFRARVVKSPFGEGAVAFSLPSVDGFEPAVQAAGASRDVVQEAAVPARGERPPGEVGTEIFRAVFQGQVRSLLDKSRGQLEVSPNLGLRLKIKLDPGDADTGMLADLPWELLCDGDTEDFFALSRQTSLVRYLDVPRPAQPIPFTPPLRILAVGASPRGLPPLDLAEEARRLEELHRGSSAVEVSFLPNASAGAVREALSGDTYNVLHFMGHGIFDPAAGEGMLAFEGVEGRLERVSGKAFATKLRDLRALGVVVLNACNTARTGHQQGASPFRGVATALVLGGVPAVVAMQRPISDGAAIGFSTSFYRHLARGDAIDEALTEGRQAIHSATPEGFEWATPVLFLRVPEGNVFVVKPAERQVQAEAPPRPPASPRVTAPIHGPSPARQRTIFKLAAGAAAAGLMAGTLYLVIPRSSVPAQPSSQRPAGTGGAPQPPAQPSSQHPAGTGGSPQAPAPLPATQAATPDTARPSRSATPGATGDLQPVQSASTATPRRAERSPAKPPPDATASSVRPGPAQDSPGNSVPPVPAPREPVKPEEPAVATADLASLSAHAVSIARRDEEGGLRVAVSFRNGAAVPLSVVLDAESTELSDNQGRRYRMLGCDLPASGSNRRLELSGGASTTVHFDFPAFKLGSQQFYLALATADGLRLRVAGSPLTLAGPP